MSITNYGELKTAVANWLTRSDLTARIPEFIELAEQRIYRSVRAREMEVQISLTASTSISVISLSASVIQIKRINVEGIDYRSLEYRNPIAFDRAYSDLPAASAPSYFTREANILRVSPVALASVTLNLLVWKKLVAFSADSDTNTLLTNSAGLFLYGALAEASPFLGNDPRILTWTAMWDDMRERVQAADAYDSKYDNVIL